MRRIGPLHVRRRPVLRALAGASAVGLAGCFTTDDEQLITDAVKIGNPYPDERDFFGRSFDIAAGGDTAIVGAGSADSPSGNGTGVAYAFERSDAEWVRTATLAPVDANEGDQFGYAVSLAADSDTALVGARWAENQDGTDAGSASVFERSGDEWHEAATLTPADGASKDNFGWSVTLEDGIALISALGRRSAFVFEQTEEDWFQQAELSPPADHEAHRFGSSVALAGDDVALVGATAGESPEGVETGAAYAFERTSEGWSETTRLSPADGEADDQFGRSVSLAGDGDTAIVGAPGATTPTSDTVDATGAAYVFERANGEWSESATLAPVDGDEGDHFGRSVRLTAEGDAALVGTPNDDNANGRYTGAASLFEREDGEWNASTKLVPADSDTYTEIGYSVELTDDRGTAILGAPFDDEGERLAGAVYVFDM